MHVEQLFVRTLIDVDRKLRDNPDEYELLKIAGLLRPVLLEKLLDDASAVAGLDARFRVVKPGPPPIPPEVQKQMDEAWAKVHAKNPGIKRVDIAVSIRPDLLSGELGPTSLPGDQVVELARRDFLKHAGVLDFSGLPVHRGAHTAGSSKQPGRHPLGPGKLESAIRGAPAVHGGFGVVWQALASRDDGRQSRAVRYVPAQPVADELTWRGLYTPASSEWIWSADGHCSVRASEPGPNSAACQP